MASCEDVALSKTNSHRGPRLALTDLTNRRQDQGEWWRGIVGQNPSKSLFSTC